MTQEGVFPRRGGVCSLERQREKGPLVAEELPFLNEGGMATGLGLVAETVEEA